jgi:hypothetical protein
MKIKTLLASLSLSFVLAGTLSAHEAGIPHVHNEGSFSSIAIVTAMTAGIAFFLRKKLFK